VLNACQNKTQLKGQWCQSHGYLALRICWLATLASHQNDEIRL